MGLRHVPESLRGALVMIGSFGLLAVALGLFSLSTTRDATVNEAEAVTELLSVGLLDEREALLGPDAAGLLAERVLTTGLVRSAAVWLGSEDDVVAVGVDAVTLTDDRVAAIVAAGSTTEQQVGVVRVATAFARVDGAPAVLETVTPIEPPRIGWTGIGIAWAIVSLGILVMSFLLERGRKDRVESLEETVTALYARDAHVARKEQDLTRNKNEFVNAISQELRAPLAVIKGVASLLARGDQLSDRQRRDLVDGLQLNADRLDMLMADLIDVDRLTQRTMPVSRRDVLVADAVDAALGNLDIGDHELELDVEGVTAHVTPGHLERILRSLLHNAVKYSPAGTTVTVRAVRSGGTVEVVVEDQGPGIAPSDRITVFEPLRQLRDDKGMGLGLALVKRFTELHGGRAWVEGAPGGGAAFHVLLPDEAAAVTVDAWQVTSEMGSQGSPSGVTP